eukprot:PhM_4_TR13699/c1_g2_i3/m.45051
MAPATCLHESPHAFKINVSFLFDLILWYFHKVITARLKMFRSVADIVKACLGSALPTDDDAAALDALFQASTLVQSADEHKRLSDSARILEAKMAAKTSSTTESPSQRKRQREAWKLSVVVTRGASMQHLRERAYHLAEECCAYAGHIAYSKPITGASNLDIELYFTDDADARHMETMVIQAVRDRWRCETIPMSSVTDVSASTDISSFSRVFAHHYNRADPLPDRCSSPFEYSEECSTKTTIHDDEQIDRESVVDRRLTSLKFERCHIDASIKGKAADTTANHIPLPSDWHDFFDACTSDNKASISIVPAGAGCIGKEETDGRQSVKVHVYFDTTDLKAQKLSSELRAATLIRSNVFEVTVWKQEAKRFCELLQSRHDSVVSKWSHVP